MLPLGAMLGEPWSILELVRTRKDALDQWRSSIAEIVRTGQRARELRREVDPVAVATLVIASLEGAVMMSRMEQTREPLFTVGRHLAEYLESLALPAKAS